MGSIDLGGYVVKGVFGGVSHTDNKPFRLKDLLSSAIRDYEWRIQSEMENNTMLENGELAPLGEPPILVNTFNLGPALTLVREKCQQAKLVDNSLFLAFTATP